VNLMRCERECDVVRSARTGFWNSDLLYHVKECAACSETQVIVQAMLGEAAQIHAEYKVPEEGRVWHSVRSQVRSGIARRAGLTFQILRGLSIIYGLVFLFWRMHNSTPSKLYLFFPVFRSELLPPWNGTADGLALIGPMIGVLCISIGFWVLQQDNSHRLTRKTNR